MGKFKLVVIFLFLFSMTVMHKEYCKELSTNLYNKRQEVLRIIFEDCTKSLDIPRCIFFITNDISQEMLKVDQEVLKDKMCYYE